LACPAHPQWQSGGDGLVSTVGEYARSSKMILHRGEMDGRRYLSPTSYVRMTTDQIWPASGVALGPFACQPRRIADW
jgi:hypothetical protein